MTIRLARKSAPATAILFDGTNGAAVVQFVRDAGEQARNGGSYVSITTDAYGVRARKGDYIVLDSDGSIKTYNQEGLDKFFKIPVTRKVKP